MTVQAVAALATRHKAGGGQEANVMAMITQNAPNRLMASSPAIYQ
jgi:hypothetical protein